MPIQITCTCGRKMRVKDEYAGKRFNCPKCGSPLIVPTIRRQVSPDAPLDRTGTEKRSDDGMNPWFSIWFHPRETIRQILEEGPVRWQLLGLAMVGGLAAWMLIDIQELANFRRPPTFSFMILVLGPIAGVFALYLVSAALWIAGKWLRGRASLKQVCTAWAWSLVPLIWALITLVPAFVIVLYRIRSLGILFLGLMVINAIIVTFQFVIFLECLGEVHGFSASKAYLASLVAGVLLAAGLLIVMLPFILL